MRMLVLALGIMLAPAMALADQAACAAGDAVACFDLGKRHYQAQPPDPSNAAEAFDRGCMLDHADACSWRGYIAEQTEAFGGQAEARKFYVRGCSLGSAFACYRGGRMFERPPVDHHSALDLWQKGCDLGRGDACLEVGILLRQSGQLRPDPERSAAAIRRGCELGDRNACIAHTDDMPPREARAVLDHFCQDGTEMACSRLDTWYNRCVDQIERDRKAFPDKPELWRHASLEACFPEASE